MMDFLRSVDFFTVYVNILDLEGLIFFKVTTGEWMFLFCSWEGVTAFFCVTHHIFPPPTSIKWMHPFWQTIILIIMYREYIINISILQ